jgi:bifunctional non-homologous end joining protein LigD
VLMAFDLLELNGQDLRPWPLVERRAELAHLLATPVDGNAFVDAHDVHGPDLFRHACAMGLEGMVCKRKDSAYLSGISPAWLKVRCPGYSRPTTAPG